MGACRGEKQKRKVLYDFLCGELALCPSCPLFILASLFSIPQSSPPSSSKLRLMYRPFSRKLTLSQNRWRAATRFRKTSQWEKKKKTHAEHRTFRIRRNKWNSVLLTLEYSLNLHFCFKMRTANSPPHHPLTIFFFENGPLSANAKQPSCAGNRNKWNVVWMRTKLGGLPESNFVSHLPCLLFKSSSFAAVPARSSKR